MNQKFNEDNRLDVLKQERTTRHWTVKRIRVRDGFKPLRVKRPQRKTTSFFLREKLEMSLGLSITLSLESL